MYASHAEVGCIVGFVICRNTSIMFGLFDSISVNLFSVPFKILCPFCYFEMRVAMIACVIVSALY